MWSVRIARSEGSRLGDVEPPPVRHALQLLLSSIGEGEAAPGNQVLHGLRDDDLARACGTQKTRADRHRQTAGLPVDHLAFADVDAGPRLEAELADALRDLVGAADRTRRSGEARE